jgi:hypothetical protein
MVTASLSLCWTLSPDVLVLFGNGIGKGGTLFLAILFLGAAFRQWLQTSFITRRFHLPGAIIGISSAPGSGRFGP